jgi:hypothetical protein
MDTIGLGSFNTNYITFENVEISKSKFKDQKFVKENNEFYKQ